MRLNLADDVLAREVLSLLAYHGATGPLDASAVGDGEYLLDLLARSADADLASPQASDVVENESVRIGPYRTIREIGRGGMGTVYLAVRDDGQFRQEVALKLLRGSIATDDFVRRFRCERQILAGIEHPNIARLVDGGRTTDGLPYFVMEYIDGTPVDTFCDTHELDTRERVRLVRKVCSAVQLAHQNFVIHRDLKPANILVTQDGEPKLLDFGIAKVLDGHEIADDTSATKLDTRLMTPDYASPEQILGENITTASDVYSIGVLLYELLTGRPPFRSTDVSYSEHIRSVCEEEPPTPSTVVPTTKHNSSRRRALRGDLDNIVLMALRKDVSRRYASVEQLSSDLENYLARRPVRACRDSASYRLTRFVQRNRVAVIVATTVAVMLSSATVFSVRERVRAERQAHIDVATSLFQRGRIHFQRGRYEQADVTLLSSLAIQERARPRDDTVYVGTLTVAGYLAHDTGRHEDAERYFRRARIVSHESLGEEQPQLASATAALAALLHDRGKLDESESLHREALALRRKLFGESHPDVADSLDWLGRVLRDLGRFEEAIETLRTALEMNREHMGEQHPATARSFHFLGTALARVGRYEEAATHLERARAIFLDTFGPRHRLSASLRASYAECLMNLGRREEAGEEITAAHDVLSPFK